MYVWSLSFLRYTIFYCLYTLIPHTKFHAISLRISMKFVINCVANHPWHTFIEKKMSFMHVRLEEKVKKEKNKTASYHKTVILSALLFCLRCLLKRWKRFSSNIFSKISKFDKFSDFFPEITSQWKWKTFLRNNIIWYAVYTNQISYILGICTISVAFYGKFAIIWR